MTRALLIRIDDFTINEFDVTPAEYQNLLGAQLSKTPVTVLGVGCEVDGNFEHDYHDIQFADGTKFFAISGFHLKPIA